MKITVDTYKSTVSGMLIEAIQPYDKGFYPVSNYEPIGTREIEIQPIKKKVKKWNWLMKSGDNGWWLTDTKYKDVEEIKKLGTRSEVIRPIEETMIEVEE